MVEKVIKKIEGDFELWLKSKNLKGECVEKSRGRNMMVGIKKKNSMDNDNVKIL